MAHSILRCFLWVGILIFAYGFFIQSFLGTGGTGYIVFALLMIIVVVGFAMAPDVLSRDHVIDNWSALIENANGKAADIFSGTESFLEQSKAPSLKVARRKVTTGLVAGMVGIERQFLVLTDTRNFSMRPFQIFINSRDYGVNLDVSWYLTYRPTIGQALASLFTRASFSPKNLDNLTVFEQQDLRVYAVNAHNCLRKAVEKIMSDSGQDPSKVDWKSKGFLGIS